MPNTLTETILLPTMANMIPGSTFVTEQNCVNFNLSLNMTGGSFSISLLKGSVRPLPIENTLLGLPFGRYGVVKQTGSGWTSGGLVDTISGVALPVTATVANSFTLAGGQSASLLLIATVLASSGIVSIGGGGLGGSGLTWETASPFIKNFSYRGIALAGVQQVANVMLADVIVKGDGIHVVNPGSSPLNASTFTIGSTDIVSASQIIDYSQDVSAVLNPALTAVQLNDDGDFVYDSEHAQKQPKFTVQTGSPSGTGSTDFIPIPDGWLIDGDYEEWTPPAGTDFSNPNASVPGGRYWKVFPSPTNPGMFRGVTSFGRLVKELKLPGNVSTFVGSPVTGQTNQDDTQQFSFSQPGVQSGIDGFDSSNISLFDIVSHQFYELNNAICIRPGVGIGSGDSGNGTSAFYSITMELWTFPRVNPQTFPVGNPANPFGIPSNVLVISPNSNVLNGFSSGYYFQYVTNYKLINSPRLRTVVTVVFRNSMPQMGDQLTIQGLTYPNCGRISNVTINFGRSGVTMTLTAEKYQFLPGLWSIVGGSIIT